MPVDTHIWVLHWLYVIYLAFTTLVRDLGLCSIEIHFFSITISIPLDGLHPTFAQTYVVLFDDDNNPETGIRIRPLVDKGRQRISDNT